MHPLRKLLPLFPCLLLLLTSCGSAPKLSSTGQPLIAGVVHGGQQPIAGVTIQLYAVGTTGDGSAATPLLSPAVTSTASGNFTLTPYACPSASALTYLVGTGGDPGLGYNNPQIALMAALGPCGNLTSSTFISVNELTTVAAVYSLAPFMTSYSTVGSGASDTAAIATAFTTASEFANFATGATPGVVPAGVTVPVNQVQTIANILANCINSGGGGVGDSTSCGKFFSLTLPAGATPPTDAIGALLNLALNPTLNTPTLWGMSTPTSPFQPGDTTMPADLSLPLTYANALVVSPAAGLVFGPTAINNSAPTQTITVYNPNASSVTFNGFSIAAPFSQTNNCNGTPLAPNASCSIVVAFHPTSLNTFSSTFTLLSTAANFSISIPLSGTSPQLTAATNTSSTTAVVFGGIKVYATESTANQIGVTLTNHGSTAVTFSGIALSGANAGDFPVQSLCGATLAAGSSCYVILNFIPSAAGTRTATLTVTSNGTTTPIVIAVSGTGVADTSNLTPSLTPIVFPTQVDSQSSQTLTTTLVNSGPDNIGISSVAITGANAGEFSAAQLTGFESSSCGSVLVPSAVCIVSVTFSPTGAGTRSANLVVTSSAVNSPLTIPLSGGGAASGTSVTLSASSLYLPNTTVGDTSAATQITLTNSAAGPVTYSGLTLTGTNTSNFTVSSNCPATIAASATCTVSAYSRPLTPGLFNANLAVNTSAANSPAIVQLESASEPELLINSGVPSVVTLPSAQTDNTSTSTLSLQNDSAHSVTLNGFTFTGTNASEFTQTNNCPGVLPSHSQTCNVVVTFQPLAVGTRTATLNVLSTALTATAMPLMGVATVNTSVTLLTANGFNFPNTGVGLNSFLSSTLNTAGGSAVVTSAAFTGANASEFSFAGSCIGVQIPLQNYNPAQPCPYAVYFNPTSPGIKSAALVLTSTASNSSLTIPITGTAVTSAPAINVSPTSLSFPGTLVGSSAAAQSFTITNNGPGTVVFNGLISLTEQQGNNFTESDTCSSIAANAFCTVTIGFAPLAVGTLNATVNLPPNNAGSGAVNVSVSGIGVGVLGNLYALPDVGMWPSGLTSPDGGATGQAGIEGVAVLVNQGTAPLTLSSIAISSGFTQTNNCGATLAAGAECEVTITPGSYPQTPAVGTLTINSNATDPVLNITLISASNPIVDFGTAKVGGAGNTVTFDGAFNNNAAYFSGTISGTNAGDFAPNPFCSTQYAAQGCSATTTFSPSATGLRVASMSYQTSPGGSTYYYTLVGTGTP
jgi:hypothetical protein